MCKQQPSPLRKSPFRKAVQRVRTPIKRQSLSKRSNSVRRQLFSDNDESDLDLTDLDYVCPADPREMGKHMEYHLGRYGKCAICHSALLIFKSCSMPLVDLVCEGVEQHLWQVKTSTKSNQYFSRQRIPIGSSRLADNLLSCQSNRHNGVVVGFILIVLTNQQIDSRRSMTMIPNLNRTDLSEAFYHETTNDFFGKRCIKPNPNLISIKPISLTIDPKISVNHLKKYVLEDCPLQK